MITAGGGEPERTRPAHSTEKVRHKLLFGFQKRGAYRFISHLDLVNVLLKTGRKAGIPFAYTEGHNPKPRMSLPFAIPLGVESAMELGEVMLQEPVSGETFVREFNRFLPVELQLFAARSRESGRSLAAEPYFHDYLVMGEPDAGLLEHLGGVIPAGKPGCADAEPAGPAAPFHRLVEEGVFLRLDRLMTIKKLFSDAPRGYQHYRVRRRALWLLRDGTLVSPL